MYGLIDTNVLLIHFLAIFKNGKYLDKVVDRRIIPAISDVEARQIAYKMFAEEMFLDKLSRKIKLSITPYVLLEFFYQVEKYLPKKEFEEFVLEFRDILSRLEEIQIPMDKLLNASLLAHLGLTDVSLLLLSEQNNWPIFSFDGRMKSISKKNL